MANVIILVSVINNKVTVSLNPALVTINDTVIFKPDTGVTINSITENQGSNNVFSTLPTSPNWTGTISSNAQGKAEKYTIKANGLSHDPKIEVKP